MQDVAVFPEVEVWDQMVHVLSFSVLELSRTKITFPQAIVIDQQVWTCETVDSLVP